MLLRQASSSRPRAGSNSDYPQEGGALAPGATVRCHSTNMHALPRARVRRTLFLKNMSPIGWSKDMQGSTMVPVASSACFTLRSRSLH